MDTIDCNAMKLLERVEINGELTDITTCTASLLEDSYIYLVSYSSNKNAGTAFATVTGIGTYKGTIQKNFTIQKARNEITASNITKQYMTKQMTVSLVASAKDGTVTAIKSRIPF